MPFTILFLCTANYYRSRFAEILFNALAGRQSLDFHATSRGVATELGTDNIGPIALHVLKALRDRNIEDFSITRFPQQVTEQDFREACLIIALDEEEHRPMMRKRYPEWADRVEYWNVADIPKTSPDEALPAIETNVRQLIDRLRTARTPL